MDDRTLTDCGCGSVAICGLVSVVSIKCNSTVLAQNPNKVYSTKLEIDCSRQVIFVVIATSNCLTSLVQFL